MSSSVVLRMACGDPILEWIAAGGTEFALGSAPVSYPKRGIRSGGERKSDEAVLMMMMGKVVEQIVKDIKTVWGQIKRTYVDDNIMKMSYNRLAGIDYHPLHDYKRADDDDLQTPLVEEALQKYLDHHFSDETKWDTSRWNYDRLRERFVHILKYGVLHYVRRNSNEASAKKKTFGGFVHDFFGKLKIATTVMVWKDSTKPAQFTSAPQKRQQRLLAVQRDVVLTQNQSEDITSEGVESVFGDESERLCGDTTVMVSKKSVLSLLEKRPKTIPADVMDAMIKLISGNHICFSHYAQTLLENFPVGRKEYALQEHHRDFDAQQNGLPPVSFEQEYDRMMQQDQNRLKLLWLSRMPKGSRTHGDMNVFLPVMGPFGEWSFVTFMPYLGEIVNYYPLGSDYPCDKMHNAARIHLYMVSLRLREAFRLCRAANYYAEPNPSNLNEKQSQLFNTEKQEGSDNHSFWYTDDAEDDKRVEDFKTHVPVMTGDEVQAILGPDRFTPLKNQKEWLKYNEARAQKYKTRLKSDAENIMIPAGKFRLQSDSIEGTGICVIQYRILEGKNLLGIELGPNVRREICGIVLSRLRAAIVSFRTELSLEKPLHYSSEYTLHLLERSSIWSMVRRDREERLFGHKLVSLAFKNDINNEDNGVSRELSDAFFEIVDLRCPHVVVWSSSFLESISNAIDSNWRAFLDGDESTVSLDRVLSRFEEALYQSHPRRTLLVIPIHIKSFCFILTLDLVLGKMALSNPERPEIAPEFYKLIWIVLQLRDLYFGGPSRKNKHTILAVARKHSLDIRTDGDFDTDHKSHWIMSSDPLKDNTRVHWNRRIIAESDANDVFELPLIPLFHPIDFLLESVTNVSSLIEEYAPMKAQPPQLEELTNLPEKTLRLLHIILSNNRDFMEEERANDRYTIDRQFSNPLYFLRVTEMKWRDAKKNNLRPPLQWVKAIENEGFEKLDKILHVNAKLQASPDHEMIIYDYDVEKDNWYQKCLQLEASSAKETPDQRVIEDSLAQEIFYNSFDYYNHMAGMAGLWNGSFARFYPKAIVSWLQSISIPLSIDFIQDNRLYNCLQFNLATQQKKDDLNRVMRNKTLRKRVVNQTIMIMRSLEMFHFIETHPISTQNKLVGPCPSQALQFCSGLMEYCVSMLRPYLPNQLYRSLRSQLRGLITIKRSLLSLIDFPYKLELKGDVPDEPMIWADEKIPKNEEKAVQRYKDTIHWVMSKSDRDPSTPESRKEDLFELFNEADLGKPMLSIRYEVNKLFSDVDETLFSSFLTDIGDILHVKFSVKIVESLPFPISTGIEFIRGIDATGKDNGPIRSVRIYLQTSKTLRELIEILQCLMTDIMAVLLFPRRFTASSLPDQKHWEYQRYGPEFCSFYQLIHGSLPLEEVPVVGDDDAELQTVKDWSQLKRRAVRQWRIATRPAKFEKLLAMPHVNYSLDSKI